MVCSQGLSPQSRGAVLLHPLCLTRSALFPAMSPLFVTLLLVYSGVALADASRDGFNIFKDRLRGKGEEEIPEESEPLEPAPRVVYFYRTPLARQSGEPLEPHPLAQDLGKQINQFRDLVMQRELDSSDLATGTGLLNRRRRRHGGSYITLAH